MLVISKPDQCRQVLTHGMLNVHSHNRSTLIFSDLNDIFYDL